MTSPQSLSEQRSGDTTFLAFAHRVLQQAAGWASELTAATYPVIIFRGTASWNDAMATRRRYDQLFLNHQKEIAQRVELREYVRQFWDDGILQYLLPRPERPTPVDELTDQHFQQLTTTMLYVLIDACERSESLRPSQEQILESYQRFRASWTATSHQHTAIIPLFNFTANLTEPIQISPHFEITPLTDEEKGWVWRVAAGFHDWSVFPFHAFQQAQFKLMGVRTLPDLNRAEDVDQALWVNSQSHVEMLYELRNIVTAFRLTKAGDVAVTGYVEQTSEVPPSGGHPGMGAPSWGWSDFQMRRHGCTYTFDTSDTTEIFSLVEALGRLDNREHRAGLEVGLRRFNQSYSRDYYEDRLIDLAVALESSLLADAESKTELRYRFALHGAALLAQQRDPEEVRAFLLKMYDARSAIVHGGKSLSEMKKKDLFGMEWRDFANASEDMTRSILGQYVRELSTNPERTVPSITAELEKRLTQGLRLLDGQSGNQRIS